MNRTETERAMHDGSLYCCADQELIDLQLSCKELQWEFNHSRPSEDARRQELLQQMFAEFGEGSYMEQPINANWGGRFVHVGKCVYANSNLTLVDDTHIYIGDYVMIGPNVTICAGSHTVSPRFRRAQYQYNLPVHIGENVWIGANTVIMPGITVGENSVIGAGSVVTKDIPANVVAVGNPCRILRPITERDEQFYHRDRPIEIEP